MTSDWTIGSITSDSGLLAAIVDSSDDAIIGKDLTGRILSWNGGAARMYGYPANEVIGQSISILVPPGQVDELTAILAEIGRGNPVAQYETVRLTKDGRLLNVSLTVSPIRSGLGEVVGASASARDITERRRLDSALRASEARWRAIVNAAIDGIVVIDDRGRIESFNPGAERLFGYAEAVVLGRNVNILMPGPFHDEHGQYLARYMADGHRHVIGIGREVSGLRHDGTTFPVHLSVGEIALGAERKFVGILHDLTTRVRAEKQLSEQVALARLGEMAAVIAHEVRNPLAAVSGAIQIIRESLPADGDEAMIAAEVLSRIGALNDLTNDLLLFARPPHPHIGAIDVIALLQMTSRLMTADPTATGLSIDIDGVSTFALGDVDLLKIALQNILTNAAQAMKGEGTIRVSVSAGESLVVMTILDSGPGISADIRDRLFQPFVTTKARGTGLGLSTVKRLVEAMGGTIALDCPPEGGTAVTICLPVAADSDVADTARL